ncbi:MAG TPA: amidohydrolase family protein [Candidatus Dormibacteraeota bacterium]|nr:amidohydrolase family protein [Candidatus Dormibacteraeota bacterium]
MIHPSQQAVAESHTAEDYLAKVEGLGIERAAALVIAPRGTWSSRARSTMRSSNCAKSIDRILFGSDYPLYRPRAALDAVAGFGLSQAELQAVLHDNAQALLEGGGS